MSKGKASIIAFPERKRQRPAIDESIAECAEIFRSVDHSMKLAGCDYSLGDLLGQIARVLLDIVQLAELG